MATAPIIMTEVPVVLADKYLFDGERVIAVLPGDGFLQERELAATEGRIICARPDAFFDIRYESLSSVGCGPTHEPAWAGASLILTALAIAFGWTAALVPASLPFGPFSISLAGLRSLIGFPAVAFGLLAIAAALVFLITARPGVVLRMPGGTFVFGYGRDKQEPAVAFTKAVRAAGHCDLECCQGRQVTEARQGLSGKGNS
jgi:hypothetical protein